MAKVVIEVKWSHNKILHTALNEQLGKDYLINEKRTHGIYFVGHTEKVTGERILKIPSQIKRNVPGDLQLALQKQANQFTIENPDCKIGVVVLDLHWKE